MTHYSNAPIELKVSMFNCHSSLHPFCTNNKWSTHKSLANANTLLCICQLYVYSCTVRHLSGNIKVEYRTFFLNMMMTCCLMMAVLLDVRQQKYTLVK